MKRRWSAIIAVLLVLNLLIMGCSSSSSAGATAAGDDGWYEKPEFNWKMQVIHSVGQTDFKLNQQAADLVYQASKGRMKIEVVPNGTFVSSAEGFQAAGEGVFEMHSSWPMYAKGIEYAFLPLSTGSLTMDAIDKYTWIYEAGGWDLMQKAFDKINYLVAQQTHVNSQTLFIPSCSQLKSSAPPPKKPLSKRQRPFFGAPRMAIH